MIWPHYCHVCQHSLTQRSLPLKRNKVLIRFSNCCVSARNRYVPNVLSNQLGVLVVSRLLVWSAGKMKPIDRWSVLEVNQLVLLGMWVWRQNRLLLSFSCKKQESESSASSNIVPSRKSHWSCGKGSELRVSLTFDLFFL